VSTLTLVLLILAVIWFWLDSARCRETAVQFCASACRERDIQFLDQTVGLRRLGIGWTSSGLRLRRTYRFDYSEEGHERHSGHLVMLGDRVVDLSFGLLAG
jgi:hypothetical protein